LRRGVIGGFCSIVGQHYAGAPLRTVIYAYFFSSVQKVELEDPSVVVLLHGGVKYDEKFSCVCLRYGEGHMFWFSSGDVFSHCVSNVRGEGPGLVKRKILCGPVRTLNPPLRIYS
jgi:hypothetical protein